MAINTYLEDIHLLEKNSLVQTNHK